MYVELMKNFLLVDPSEILAVRTVILASWAQKRWFLLSRHDVRQVHEKFSSRRFKQAMAVRVVPASWAQKRFDSYFQDMMYVEFLKNFLLVDPSEIIGS